MEGASLVLGIIGFFLLSWIFLEMAYQILIKRGVQYYFKFMQQYEAHKKAVLKKNSEKE